MQERGNSGKHRERKMDEEGRKGGRGDGMKRGRAGEGKGGRGVEGKRERGQEGMTGRGGGKYRERKESG